LALLAEVKRQWPETVVILMTAYASLETCRGAFRQGAYDYVQKEGEFHEELKLLVGRAAEQRELRDDNRRLTGTVETMRKGVVAVRGESSALRQARSLADKVAVTDSTVLLRGESGTGKDLFARAIHFGSRRAAGPWVKVNCGAIPEALLESELFGHEKGAFTGAVRQKPGRFEDASGGTLFLDEIGELPLDAQVKLLRAIQEGEVDPVGAKKPVKVDIRLISATNKSLLDLVKGGGFREDLYYRLNVFPMTLPPLRARREDIPDLARSFLARFAAEEGKRVRGIAAEALSLLVRYDWPGNVRQLENALFRAVVLADGDELTLAEFPQIVCQVEGFELRIPPAPTFADGAPAPVREIVRVEVRDPHAISLVDESGDMRKLEELEAEIIRFALQHYRGHMSAVSRRLGIGRSTLYRKLKDLGLASEGEADAA
ncbi:MAG: sigma-54 dependent transcriptional regulator, partial [Microvirga sp.]